MRLYLFIAFTVTIAKAQAQIGIGTSAPHASAALEIKDTSRGILIPRMSMAHRTAILTPAEGLMVFQTDNYKGFWFFDGSQWKTLTLQTGSGNIGKHTLVFADDITNEEAIAKIATDFGSATQEVVIRGCTKLTTIDLSMLTNAVEIAITENEVLQSVNLQNLTTVDRDLKIYECPQLTDLNLTSLTKVMEYMTFRNLGIGTLTLPLLTRCISELEIQNNPNLTNVSLPSLKSTRQISISNNKVASISFPMLVTCESFYVGNNTYLTSFTCPTLTSVRTFYFANNNSISSLSFPALTSFLSALTQSNISECSSLTSITFDALSSFQNSSLTITSNKLPSSQINYLLDKLVSITPSLTGITVDLSKNLPPAPPTGQGITNKVTLVSRGNVIITD